MQSQTYHSLSLHRWKDRPHDWASKTKIENGLMGYDATVTENQEGFKILIKYSAMYEGKLLTYSVLNKQWFYCVSLSVRKVVKVAHT